MSDIDRLRDSLPWAKGMGDAELIGEVSKRAKMSPTEVAEILGVQTGAKRSALAAGLSSGVDDLQGLGYSALAAGADALGATGARDWLNRRADANQVESQLNGRPDLERVEDQTLGSALPYLGYQVAKQVPNLAASIGAGLLAPEVAVPAALTRVATVGPRVLGMGGLGSRVAAAAEAGTSQFAARRAALEAGQTFSKQVVGGGAMNYAQGVGSLYQEANDGGDPNAGWAAIAGGVPYALTETLPEAMLVGRIGHGSGFRGGLPTRVAKAGLTQGLAGATSEGLQNEMEMAYNGQVTDDQAFSRRLNSMAAGGLVEGFLGLGGGIRRAGPKVSADGTKIDLLGTQPPAPPSFTGQGELFDPAGEASYLPGMAPPTTDPGYSREEFATLTNQRRALELQISRLTAQAPMAQQDPAAAAALNRQIMTLTAEHGRLTEALDAFPSDFTGNPNALPGQQRLMFDTPMANYGEPGALFNAEAASQPAVATPTGIEQNLGLRFPDQNLANQRAADMQAALAEPTGHVALDPATQQELPLDSGDYATVAGNTMEARAREAQMQAQAAKVAADIRARDERAQKYGIKGTRGFELFSELEEALQSGVITDAQFVQATGMVAANKAPAVKKFLEGIKATKDAIAASDAAPITPLNKPAAPLAGIDPNKTTEVGRAGRRQVVTPQQLLAKLKAANPLDKARILAATGMDVTTDPTTGAPKLVESGTPMTLEQIAEEESQRTGKKVTKQAIQQALAKFGITEDVVTQMAATSPTNVTAEELGIDPNAAEGSGYRVEDRASKATGSGMVNTAEDGQLSKKQQEQVNKALVEARGAGFEPEALAATAGKLSGAAKVRFLALAAKEMAAAAPVAAPTPDAPKAPAGAKVADLRDGNDARVAANTQRLLALPKAATAAADWESDIPWSQVPDTVKADFIAAHIELSHRLDNQEGFEYKDFARQLAIANDQAEKDAREIIRQQPAQAAQSGSLAAPARAEQAQGAAPAALADGRDQSQGTGSYVGESGSRAGDASKPVVQTKPSREGLPESATKEEQAAYTRQANKVAKYETLLACLTR